MTILEDEVDKLQVDKRIQGRVKKQMERAQKEYYLNEKMKAIQKELGRKDDRLNEIEELRKKIEMAKMPKDAEERALQELKRLESMPPMSAEATVSRNYLDWLIAVPWSRRTRERKDLLSAETILNDDHYGLEKVKERIVEFLAVRQLVNKPKGPILCFVGPPGVGKTSLAKSIARCTNRKFVRMSLGGVRDEAEIRGHRRTYIGAFPGQIVQMMKKAGTRNPVFLLDEVDKMSMDFRGDPSAALLEVLDPEQNHSFTDHYLDVEFDLSSVFFIATANVLHTIPQPLQDRMEVLRLPGYTEREKVEIAKRHLIPKQVKSHGLRPENISFTDDALQESAHAALSYVRSRAEQLGIMPGFNRRTDIHIHVPEGAIPKDGPSAGITIATALVSALTKIPVRREVAMTGEITLRGKVLPIGGVKEKLLAAHRIGVTTIVLPRENEKDLADIPKVVLDTVTVELVEHVDEVLKIALAPPAPPPAEVAEPPVPPALGDVRDGMTH